MKTSHLKLPDIRFRIVYTALVITLAIIGSVVPDSTEIQAEPELSRWHSVPLPRQGDIGGWVLAKGSDLTHLTKADDGTLYCSVTGTTAPSVLFRSTDNGTTWRYTGNVGSVKAINTVPGKPDLLYYTDGSDIYRSDNKGISFTVLPHLPGVLSSDNVIITSFDTADIGGVVVVVAGTSDTDVGETGGVYLLTDNTTNPSWSDTGIGPCDITEVRFSPHYGIDRRVYAVVNDEDSTYFSIYEDSAGWDSRYGRVNVTTGIAENAAITLLSQPASVPDDFSVFIGLDSGNGTGDVYRADMVTLPGASVVNDLNIGSTYNQYGTDVTSLAAGTIDGETVFLAGSADSGYVYWSGDEGQTWMRSTRPATGGGDTIVIQDSEGRVCTVTSGQGSAFSRSADGGVTFAQVSLIDTEISNSCIMDIAPSPRYSADSTLFMLTLDINSMEYSVWRSVSNDISWERILGTSLSTSTSIERIMISPAYSESEPVVYLYGLTGGSPVIWRSGDNGQSFSQTGVPYPIDTWTIIDDETQYIGCHDGTNSRVFSTADGGQTWSGGTAIDGLTLSSIEQSPDFINDAVMFVANLGGRVYYSDDGGYSYRTLPLDATSPPFSGKVVIKPDPLFAENGIVYAVSDAAGEGLHRFILGESDEWERIDNSLPATARISDLIITENGILYATNTDFIDNSASYGGVERSLNPSYHLFPSFESVYSGLDDTVFLRQSWISENRLWSIDASSDRLMTYIDSLTGKVMPLSPWNGQDDIGIQNAVLDWYEMEGATEYEWQIDYDGSFAAIPSGFTGTTGATRAHLPDLKPDTRYVWRVRAIKPSSSQWSERFSFSTGFSDGILCPELLFPEAGAELMSSKPLFQWGPIAGADKYELMVAAHNSFSAPLIKKTGRQALKGTAWQSETVLDPDTVYYWKVRAIRSGGYSDWSAVGAFSIVTRAQTEHESSLAGTETPVLQDLPVLLCPGYDNDLTATRPLFQWDAVTGADCYELVVSPDTRFENPVIIKAGQYSIPVSAWRCNIALEPDTAYYWKVRAVTNGSYGAWSPVSAFLVGEDPELTTVGGIGRESERIDGEGPTTVVIPDGNGLPQWAVFMGIGLLIVIAMLQIAILVTFLLTRGKRI